MSWLGSYFWDEKFSFKTVEWPFTSPPWRFVLRKSLHYDGRSSDIGRKKKMRWAILCFFFCFSLTGEYMKLLVRVKLNEEQTIHVRCGIDALSMLPRRMMGNHIPDKWALFSGKLYHCSSTVHEIRKLCWWQIQPEEFFFFFCIKSYFPNCNFMVVLLFTVFSAVYNNPDPYSLQHLILLNGDSAIQGH